MNVTGTLEISETIERVQPAVALQQASNKNILHTISYQISDPVESLGNGDQASLSSVSSVIADTLSTFDSDVRWDRIESLQQAIASGSYSVSSTDVAASVLSYLVNE